MNKLLSTIAILTVSIFLSGCLSPRINGGKVTHKSNTGSETSQNQSDDPKASSKTEGESSVYTKLVIPSGSKIESIDKNGIKTVITVSSNTVFETKVEDKNKTELGASQKNYAAEFAAKLSSMKGIMWAGVALMLFGIASLFYPPLKLIVGSTTTSIACSGAGLLLIILPTIIVGHEALILSLCFGGVAAYWFIHRYAGNSREIKVLREFIDKNNDGIDDSTGETREEFDRIDKDV